MKNRNRISLAQRSLVAIAAVVLASLATASAASADDLFVPDPGTCTTNVLGGPASQCGTDPALVPDSGTCTTDVLGGGASQCGAAAVAAASGTVAPHHRKLPHVRHHHR